MPRTTFRTVPLIGISLAALALSAVPATMADTPREGVKVLSLQAARRADFTFFLIDVARPDDMSAMTIEQSSMWATRRVWPRMAELRGEPAWECTCYLEFAQADTWWTPVARRDRLTFVGRCPAARGELALTSRYPLEDGGWHEETLKLDLARAGAWPAEPPPPKRWASAQVAWFDLLRRYTQDPGGFYTFAAQQTCRQNGLPEVNLTIRPTWTPMHPEEALYDVTTGALAVQESLQLDRMTNPDRDRGQREIPIKDIAAVGVRSHPFDKMRGDKQPVHSPLARLTPEDFYYLRFGSVAKLYELLDFTDQWGPSLLRLATAVGTDYGVRERVHRQLCLPETLLARVLGPAVISELAVVGSDPYFQEGTDVTVLFRVSVKPAFQLAVDPYIQQAKQEFPAAIHETVTYEGVQIERLVDPQRRVSCHRCWLDDVCMYSNSLAAAKRIIDTHTGRRPSLADAPDFKYMRASVFPLDPAAEDGFLYLSDPFIRHLVGPELRIKEKRRLEVITSLKMISNAALLYGYEFGPGQPKMEKLTAAGCLTPGDLYDPDDGTFDWDPRRGVALNSLYGDLSFVTPLIEIDSDRATAKEHQQYQRFRDRYQNYWRQYFDPIGVRIKVDRTIRLEPHILPLIDVSAYDQFENLASGEPVEVRLDRFTPSTLLRVVMHLNDGTLKAQAAGFMRMVGGGTNAASDWVGDWATFWIEDTDAFRELLRRQYRAEERDQPGSSDEVLDIFNASFVLGIHVKNKLSLAAFLVALRSFVQTTAPNVVLFNNLEPYQGYTIVQVAPDPCGELAREFRGSGPDTQPALPSDTPPASTTLAGTTQPAISERGPALYYAGIGDGLYISTQASALRRLVDRVIEQPTVAAPADARRSNLFLYGAPGAADLLRPTVSCLLEHQAREISVRNLTQVWLLGRCGALDGRSLDEAARAYLGYRLVCPDGGAYRFEQERAEAVSSVHGPLSNPLRLDALPEGSPLQTLLNTVRTLVASLRFTDDGLSTTVEIGRQ